VFFEVSNDTGMRAQRWIDAVAVGIWPSTGHEVIGIEIKVSRSDWQRELKAPEKAQSLMRFCTRWFLACPAGMVKPAELPGTWGMLTFKEGAIRTAQPAPRLDPEPLTAGFMMAVLRNANGVDEGLINRLINDQMAERRKKFDEEVDRAAKYRVHDVSSRNDKALKITAAIEAMAGEKIDDWTFDEKAFAATYHFLKLSRLHAGDVFRCESIPSIIDNLSQAQETLRKIYDDPAVAEVRARLAAGDVAKRGRKEVA